MYTTFLTRLVGSSTAGISRCLSSSGGRIFKQRCLTPPITRVVGSRRFKLELGSLSKGKLGFLAIESWESITKAGFRPMLEASKSSKPAAGRKSKTIHHFKSFLTIRPIKSFLIRKPGFLRFLRTRTLILPTSSESSSDTEMEMLLPLNIEDDIKTRVSN